MEGQVESDSSRAEQVVEDFSVAEPSNRPTTSVLDSPEVRDQILLLRHDIIPFVPALCCTSVMNRVTDPCLVAVLVVSRAFSVTIRRFVFGPTDSPSSSPCYQAHLRVKTVITRVNT